MPYDALTLRDAIGDLADGLTIEDELLAACQEAVRGAIETADRGPQDFVVGVAQADHPSCDTSEIVWFRSPDGDGHPDDTPLRVLTCSELFAAERARWLERDPVAWTAFFWRVAAPLVRRLRLPAPW